ncbi:HAD-like domain-containing protein [Yarrowia lipolytica]|jgi:HAD superfamily hydrolase (TIGR01456 family)|uniref:YALI0A01045p n=2 Tax=Yarrowia lipolytica TaxID=4952 RepID=Q6CI71_YARLI|nr:YALI0A01045p [Yarrowia lipolytica CLIB122]AOW00122.1 hypothetical protein YALI1_A01468g [Yarrowia lipolytica]KAB8280915.1 HAD-like domain-containing protein [Yarrowia lipolytica]KAE8170193.1 HAD-like domain-containing protein [Yarrowia lipolytica]KAJ8051256.1 HAD-like domain-containing protein [Yarrowia lipolytica]QNP95022.1 hypothetical protein YALI2_A00021g [Yarrowia lipolytica]|eukprot:XP_499640.1 YALI0A01045p [Yarrowia lipolytica CLIB122]
MLRALKTRQLAPIFRQRVVTRLLTTAPAAKLSYVFDIDGVLMHGGEAIPQGRQALLELEQAQVPWILLTNGGGKSEVQRTEELSKALDFYIDPQQIVQSHTPFRGLSGQYERVLVVGGDHDMSRQVAELYGFKHVIVPADIVRATPHVWPYHRLTEKDDFWVLPKKECDQLVDPNSGMNKVDAVFIFNDPRDWGTDVQIVMDMLLSQDGHIGTKANWHPRPSEPTLKSPSIPIYFSNNDLLWANQYPLPRLGQGALRTTIEALFTELTGYKLRSTIIGKPVRETYEFAEETLDDWRQKTFNLAPGSWEKVYMVGDNPASDIDGANRYGWESMLVRTGVFRDADLPDAVAKPNAGIYDNVLDAVRAGIKRHY